jgi:hypothetical protein
MRDTIKGRKRGVGFSSSLELFRNGEKRKRDSEDDFETLEALSLSCGWVVNPRLLLYLVFV